jgi:hypothetical protein
MKRAWTIAFAALMLLQASPARISADEPGQKDGLKGQLVGTWKQVSARYDGREFRFPEGVRTIKHVTPTQFMWVSYDPEGKVTRCAGGSYTLAGEDYEELPEYGMSGDFDVIRGKKQSFKCKIVDGKWHHDGKLSNGLTIEEVWERVEK